MNKKEEVKLEALKLLEQYEQEILDVSRKYDEKVKDLQQEYKDQITPDESKEVKKLIYNYSRGILANMM